MTDAAARYQSIDGEARVVQNLVYNPSSGNWELEQQGVIEAVTSNLYLALDEVEAKLDSLYAITATGQSVLDSGNSTSDTLGADATFTGTGVDCLGYHSVAITLFSSHDSADSGMTFQFSTDNTNWDDVYRFTLDQSASAARRFQFPVTARYFRVVYTNGSTAQTAFRVQTILHKSNILTSIHRIGATLTGDRSCQVVKASIVGETTAAGGAYVNVKVNPSGALAVDLDAIEDSLTDYHFYAWEVDTNVYYLGYQTKSAAWYAKKIDPAAGTCLYASGGSSPPTPANLSAQSYDSFEATF